MAAFFTTTIVSAVLDFFPIQLGRAVFLVVGLALLLGVMPGLLAAFLELGKVDTKKGAGRIVEKVLITIILVFGVLFGSTSVDNILKVLGLELPFYSVLRGLWTEAWLVGSSILVFCGVIVRKYGLTTNSEELPTTTKTKSKWTVGEIMMMTGYLLVFGGFFVAVIDTLALEGLLATVSGLVLFSVGRLMWKISRNKNRETSA